MKKTDLKGVFLLVKMIFCMGINTKIHIFKEKSRAKVGNNVLNKVATTFLELESTLLA